MIDYIRGYFKNKDLVFNHVNSSYGMNSNRYSRFDKIKKQIVEYNTYFKEFHNLYFKITNKRGFVENSLHSLYNNINGSEINRNDNDFNYSNLLASLDFIKNISDYPLDEVYISQNLEFGFNLVVPFDIDCFILNDCVLLDYKSHTWLEDKDDKTLKSFTKGYYRLKIYNKSKQFALPFRLLRIEFKFIDKRGFNRLGIYTMSDLANKENLYKIYRLMFKFISEELLIVDNIETQNVSEYVKRKLYRYCSSKFWNELPLSKLNCEKLKCYKMLSKNNLLNNKKTLLMLMESKFYELISN